MMNNLWEGYDNQECVLLEDMDPFHKSLSYDIKIWADRYSFRGRVLYGSITLRPKKIVITSQYHPRDIWEDAKTVQAICDRFNIIHLEEMEVVDNTTPPKKKPTLKRAVAQEWNNPPYVQVPIMGPHLNPLHGTNEIIRRFDNDNYCLNCHIAPCICQEMLDLTETEEDNEIIID